MLEQNNVLMDRMSSMLEQLKMHLFFERLIDIGRNIQKEEIPYSTSTLNQKVELPILSRLDIIIREIQITIGRRDEEEPSRAFKSLRRRKSEIEGDMGDTTLPILRIFPSGSFENEIRLSLETYKKDTGRSFPSKDTLLKDGDLWSYLNDVSSVLRLKLFHDVILRFREELDRMDSVKDFEVSEYVKKNLRVARRYAEKSVSYLLPVRGKILDRSVNIPKVVIGSDKKVITDVIRLFRQENFLEFEDKGDHILEIPELKNIMVFFIEHGNYEPLEDLVYMPEVQQMEREYPATLREMSPHKWFVFRNPYLNGILTPEAAAALQVDKSRLSDIPQTQTDSADSESV